MWILHTLNKWDNTERHYKEHSEYQKGNQLRKSFINIAFISKV
jgi:hypothetical protein